MVKVIRSQQRLYRSPNIKTRGRKRSRVLDVIPIISDEKEEKGLDPNDHKWEMQFFELKKFKKKYRHCDVSVKSKKYYRLACWVNTQRTKKKLRPLKYNPEHLQKLNEIGFCWDILEKQWNEKFNEIKRFKVQYGHCNVTPGGNNGKYRLLAEWCSRQRVNYRRKFFSLTKERIKRLESIGFQWQNPNLKLFNGAMLLDELKRLHLLLGRTPTQADIIKSGKYNVSVYYRIFGSIPNARKKAGLEAIIPVKKIISEEALLNDLKRIWNELKITPSSKNINKYGKYNVITYITRFGSVIKAREKAGLGTVPIPRTHITDSELLNDLTYLQKKLKRVPTWTDIVKHGNFSPDTYHRFGSIEDAREKAGLERVIKRTAKFSDKELLNDLKRLQLKLNKTPGIKDIINEGKYSTVTYSTRFGSILKARKKAGLAIKIKTSVRISDEELFNEIKRLHKKLNRIPYSTDMVNYGKIDFGTYHRRFGSWKNAIFKALN